MKTITFCTANKGYTEYLKQTYKNNIQVASDPRYTFVLVNYDSPDDMDSWVNTNLSEEIAEGKVTYKKYSNLPVWNFSKAKNMAHALGTGEYLCNLDADNILTKEFLQWVDELIENSAPFVTAGSINGSGGRVLISKADFELFGGYNELFDVAKDHQELCALANRNGRLVHLVPQLHTPFIENAEVEKNQYTRMTRANFNVELKADKLTYYSRLNT